MTTTTILSIALLANFVCLFLLNMKVRKHQAALDRLRNGAPE